MNLTVSTKEKTLKARGKITCIRAMFDYILFLLT